MLETIDLTQILIAVLTILSAVLTRYIVPLVKSKLSNKQQEDLAYWAGVAVMAVEEAARAGRIARGEKFGEVVKFLEGKGFTLDEAELTALIDSTVWQLINQFKTEASAA